MNRLAIAIPCRDAISADAFPHIARSILECGILWQKTYGSEADVAIYVVARAHVAEARNEIALQCIKDNCDWILWMDDDAVPPPAILGKLLASGKEFIAPIFFMKNPPYLPTCFEWDLPEPPPRTYNGMLKGRRCQLDPPRLFRADATGFHTVLMSGRVLKRVQEILPEGQHVFTRTGQNSGEDITFCYWAWKAGLDLWIDSRIEVGHVGTRVITKDDFLREQSVV